MTLANFTDQGLTIGQNDSNMTYMYGLADFFTVMFQDTSTVNLLLEATTQGCSDVYSNFLQLTSTLSLQGISETVNSSIHLVLINTTNAVSGAVNSYTLTESIQSARYVADKPFLPTTLLEQTVDFNITTATNGVSTITFANGLDSYGFPIRTNSDGSTQYAMWFVDANIDERLISQYYGNLIGVTPQNSSDTFSNFVYGLFYVYVQGPTLDIISKGLNVVLGIPLARAAETVLDIRNYLETSQYIVITDQNQYIIPYGIPPSVAIGDVLAVGDELAQWVIIKDYEHDGNWWINLQIPPTIIPSLPDGQKDRYATAGSHFDYLMQNYLKKHTFLVLVNVSTFENIQNFQQLSDIITRAKPTYTQPIYIWTIENLTETMTLSETEFLSRVDPTQCENLGLPIEKFYRGNTADAITRGCAQFIRYNVPYYVQSLCGTDPYFNGTGYTIQDGPINGFRDSIHQYRNNTTIEQSWMATQMSRGSEAWMGSRSQVGFHRGTYDIGDLDENGFVNGTPVVVSSDAWNVPAGMRVIPLYITTQADINSKCATIGLTPPTTAQWYFELFGQDSNSQAINALAFNTGVDPVGQQQLISNYSTLFFRGSTVGYLSVAIPEDTGWQTYAPTTSQIQTSDYLLGIRILSDVIGIYWVTSNTDTSVPIYFPVQVRDPAVLTYDMPLTRNGAVNGTPYYNLRGYGYLDWSAESEEGNASAINDAGTTTGPVLRQAYADQYNPSNVTVDRSGVAIIHATQYN